MDNDVNPRTMARNFAKRGFKNTSDWIIFSLENKTSPFKDDIQYIITSFKTEFRSWRHEFYDDPKFNDECLEKIFTIYLGGMSQGTREFNALSTKLTPLVSKVLDSSEGMNSLINDVKKLDLSEKFERYCHYYQMLWESDYKLFRRNLLAMKRLREGRKVGVTETFAITRGENEIESTTSLEEVIPERLKSVDYWHIRNAIAHSNCKFIKEEGKMKFWDVNPKTQKYSWGPKKYSFEEFSKCLIEINLFCETFVLVTFLLMTLDALKKP